MGVLRITTEKFDLTPTRGLKGNLAEACAKQIIARALQVAGPQIQAFLNSEYGFDDIRKRWTPEAYLSYVLMSPGAFYVSRHPRTGEVVAVQALKHAIPAREVTWDAYVDPKFSGSRRLFAAAYEVFSDAFDHNMVVIRAYIADKNRPAARMASAMGFVVAGKLSYGTYTNGQAGDMLIFEKFHPALTGALSQVISHGERGLSDTAGTATSESVSTEPPTDATDSADIYADQHGAGSELLRDVQSGDDAKPDEPISTPGTDGSTSSPIGLRGRQRVTSRVSVGLRDTNIVARAAEAVRGLLHQGVHQSDDSAD